MLKDDMVDEHPQIISRNGAKVRLPRNSITGPGTLIIGSLWNDFLPLPTQFLIRPGGKLHLGAEFTMHTGASVCIESGAQLTLANGFTNVGFKLVCWRSVTFGREATISENVTMRDADNHWISGGKPHGDGIVLGDRVWIGLGATVLKNVHLGDGVIVGAGSVVTRSIKAGWLAAGNPAKPIREATWGN